jgi:hypothetical protein
VAVPGPRIDHLHEVVRWLDHWCKQRDTGIMDEPPVVIYVRHYERPDADRLEAAGEWRAEESWPAPGAGEQILYPASDGLLALAPGADGEDQFQYIPSVGVTAGLWSGGLQFGQPGDQRLDEAHSLVYTSAPLTDTLYVIGRIQTILHLASTASVIGFAVAVSDVAPDGSSHLVAKGMLNATRRESLTDPTPLTPGERYELAIEVDCTAWRFEPGHRIRLAVASADWPNVWPTPEPATNTIFRGQAYPSRLILPTVPAQGSAEPPAFRPSPVERERHSLKAEPPTWEIVRDALTRRSRVRLRNGNSARITPTTVVTRESCLDAQVDDDDPAGASARGSHVSTIERPGGSTVASSELSMQATATHFHVHIALRVDVDGFTHHSREWTRSIPRRLL